MDIRTFEIEEEHAGQRLDKILAKLCDDLSRVRLQALIKDGDVEMNGFEASNASGKVSVGDVIKISIPAPVDAEPKAQNIPLSIVFEDEHMLVINKPVGMVVHPGAGNHDGTLVNALLHHCGESLSGIGGVLRPGIVHRLDKETSGLMVVAKNDRAHQGLSAQLADRSLSRVYHALVFGVPVPLTGVVDKPIGRDPRNRIKMTVTGKNSKDAVTEYKVLQEYSGAVSLVECRLQTGRTHQIRVHMGAIKNSLVGDPLYGPQPTALNAALKKSGYDENIRKTLMEFPYQILHAKEIAFVHPVTEEEMQFESGYPESMSNILKIL